MSGQGTKIFPATKKRIGNFPDTPGVYFFLNKSRKILYIGKATSLRDRVRSYYTKDLLLTRGPLIEKMIKEATNVQLIKTDSVLEALILEAHEIKKHQPFYNSKEKDDRSYNYVIITKEDFPRLLTVRGRGLTKMSNQKFEIAYKFGPFPHAGELRNALKIVRKIFPYRDEKCKINNKGKPCFNAQIGLCPGPCAKKISKGEYKKIIRHIRLFFEAKKVTLIKSLEKEMKTLSKKHKFEEAQEMKKKLYALDHIQDVALIREDYGKQYLRNIFRIEAYDIAHLGGRDSVGVMTVITDGELDKAQYRKFKIRSVKGNDDVGNLGEVLLRRLGHFEWTLPNLIVVDGGVAQINKAKEILKERNFNIPIISVVKDNRHRVKEVLGERRYVEKYAKEILLVNSEAHRFAISYHRRLRRKGFRI